MSNFGVKPIDVTVEKLEKIAKMDVNELSVNETSDNSSLPTSKVVHEAIVGETTKYLPLEAETEWIFDGGNSESSINIEFKIDEDVSNSSKNAIQNKAIKNYVDEKTQLLNQKIKGLEEKNEEFADFVVEQGVSHNGIYRKWNSGIAECWKRVEISNIARNEELNEFFYTPRISLGNFPSGLFKEVPYVLNISLQNPEFSSFIETGAIPTTKDFVGSVYLGSTVAKDSMYVTICIYAMGYWK